jgi:hypothetical protein
MQDAAVQFVVKHPSRVQRRPHIDILRMPVSLLHQRHCHSVQIPVRAHRPALGHGARSTVVIRRRRQMGRAGGLGGKEAVQEGREGVGADQAVGEVPAVTVRHIVGIVERLPAPESLFPLTLPGR